MRLRKAGAPSRDRLAIRGEPLLPVKGKLAQNDGTVNVHCGGGAGTAPDSKDWGLTSQAR